MKDLEDRKDIYKLVSHFYAKVRDNPEIGYFFNNSIQDWEEHFEKLTDFWESNLFFTGSYKGNPGRAHISVDSKNQNSITEYHFGIWMNLWFSSIDELFKGENAQRLKNNARKMSTHIFLRIYQARLSTK